MLGKFSGKLLTVYITPSGVRVCEGENKNGNPNISKFFLVGGVSDYFALASDSKPPEIVNMSGLVSAIVEECKNRNTSARRVLVCSDCFGISTEITRSAGLGSLKTVLSGDIKNLKFGGSKDRPSTTPDKMACKQTWGDLTIDGSVNKISTTTVGDKFLLTSLVTEFYNHGYEVIYISGALEALMNLRQTEAANFDSRGKVIFDYDVSCSMAVFFQDMPVELQTIPMVEQDQLIGRIRSQLDSARQKTGRNPKIYLNGSVFHDPQLYISVMDTLEADGCFIYDMFGRMEVPPNYEELVAQGSMEPQLTPDFGVNIAMLLAGFNKVKISLTPQVDMADVFKKNSKVIATLGCGAAAILLVSSAALAGLRVYDLYQIRSNPSIVGSLQSQVTTLQSRQQSLNSTIRTLTEADTTILELMRFIDTNQNDRVHVVSVDTRDMLSDELSVDTSDVAVTAPTTTDTTTTDVVSGSAGGGSGVIRESIVIRGYAKSGTEAVSYFNRLFRHGFTSDPVLNGVERYTLPGGEEVYVFEIEIGGDL